jgi:hypothetical protein
MAHWWEFGVSKFETRNEIEINCTHDIHTEAHSRFHCFGRFQGFQAGVFEYPIR